MALKNDSICKIRLILLKNNVYRSFDLDVNKEKTTYLINEFLNENRGLDQEK